MPELQAGVQAGRRADEDWLCTPPTTSSTLPRSWPSSTRPRDRARPRPHQARAEALDQQIASKSPTQSAHITAHAFAVHDLRGSTVPAATRSASTMLRFVATHPPGERATLQASKVAALLSDALGARRGWPCLTTSSSCSVVPSTTRLSSRMALARDSALVLLLLDADAVEPGGRTDVATPITDAPTGSSSPSPEHERDQETSVDGGDAAGDADNRGIDAIAEIAGEAERAIVAAAAERHARYQRAVDAGSLPRRPRRSCRDAAADDDHEQAWSLLRPRPLPIPPAVAPRLSPQRRRPRYRALRPTKKRARPQGPNTPNYLDDIVWCDRGAQVTPGHQGSMSAPMGRTMVAILTHALVDAPRTRAPHRPDPSPRRP